jgi:hypothetical protein
MAVYCSLFALLFAFCLLLLLMLMLMLLFLPSLVLDTMARLWSHPLAHTRTRTPTHTHNTHSIPVVKRLDVKLPSSQSSSVAEEVIQVSPVFEDAHAKQQHGVARQPTRDTILEGGISIFTLLLASCGRLLLSWACFTTTSKRQQQQQQQVQMKEAFYD